ncbi:MAG: arsenate reductase ArsC [Pseudomonadota bacterium]
MHAPKSILVLCTGNSARSILAEALFYRLGEGRVSAYSAGSKPKGRPHRMALTVLEDKGYDTDFARSKSWTEFEGESAPDLDFVVTVCDSAASETCPVWPGAPLTAHWGIPDPAAVEEPEAAVREAFEVGYDRLKARVSAYYDIPFSEIDEAEARKRLKMIGETPI